VLNAASVETGKQLVRLQEQRIPPSEQPAALRALLPQFYTLPDPRWPEARRALCRVDANSRNFIRRPDVWMSVDWENSGWGDPAFEIAELITHPAYRDVPAARWDWVAHGYSQLSDDRSAATRIEVYRATMLVWWVVRLARTLYEVPRGLDRRLVERPAAWQAETTRLYQHYLDLASGFLNNF
jgi:hypothetical protein